LRTALAMGANKAVHVRTEVVMQPLAAAKLIAYVVREMQAQLVIAGKQAIDDDANQTGQMVASLLKWGCATFASEVKITGDEVQVVREVDGGLMRVQTKLPCVITTDLRLNQPRYASLPNIMKARAKPIEVIEASSLGIDIAPRLQTQRVSAPRVRAGGVKLANVDELVHNLKNVAKII
jgi:electron transfer flavoprotein beta subunit